MPSKKMFIPETDIPDLTGKVVFITGGNAGLGHETALRLAQHNATIYLTSRSLAKGESAVSSIKATIPSAQLHLIQLDLSSLASVESAARAFLQRESRLDILINNAGIMAVPPSLSTDRYEIQFATNYLGHAYLTQLLLPVLVKSAAEPGSDVRIVTLSSVSHSWTPKGGIAFSALKTGMDKQGRVSCYGQSKLACLLHSRELARRYGRIKCVAVDPGNVRTGLSRSARESSWWMGALDRVLGVLIGVDVEEGAKTQVWAAVGKVGEGEGGVESGEYYEPGLIKGDGSKDSRSVELAGRLWEWTEKELEAWKQSGKRVGSD